MYDSLFSLEFTEFGKEDADPFANCITSCVPRIGETISLYLVAHQGHHSYTVVDVDYTFDCRNDHGRSPTHWGMQPVLIVVEKI